MKFKDLNVGERFHFNVDADGHEPYMYKLSDTEAYVEHGSHSGLRETVEAETEVWQWNEPVVLHDTVTDVERTALTLLMGFRGDRPDVDHPGLYYYIKALVEDPNEIRSLDRFIWEATGVMDGEEMPLREICIDRGYVCWEKEYDREHSAEFAIIDEQPGGQPPQTREARWFAEMDHVAGRLVHAVRSYRIAGRPAGDYTSGRVSGKGSTLGYVETSLAAAIVEFHWQRLEIYAGENEDLEMALRSATPEDLITQTEAAGLANVTPQAINNAIRSRRLRAYSDLNAVSHKPGDRRVSRADVERLWPPREA